MPTGYTADIANNISFKEFALRCARGFGALVTLRDEPSDAPIPERFQPSRYYDTLLLETTVELKRVEAMSDYAAEEEATAEFRKQEEEHKSRLRANEELLAKYEAMLNDARCWMPPSADHVQLKEFMIQQIEESIRFDCNTDYLLKHAPKKLSGKEWRQEQIAKLQKSIVYYEQERQKEIIRIENRNTWIKQLRESL